MLLIKVREGLIDTYQIFFCGATTTGTRLRGKIGVSLPLVRPVTWKVLHSNMRMNKGAENRNSFILKKIEKTLIPE